ncbi:homologous-pairing protein 2 homolog [Topomyia yanbarensis]|uniref:homologous-pairing protein 2 homolog n=1 Tax=Topomyia yanbarensis TaxID=2498891 RepID=UPI00273C63E8|nr:homologous-pairing protein 2 homolog [Topomyia yanbarensis]
MASSSSASVVSTGGEISTKATILKLLDDQQRPVSLTDISEKVKDLGKSSVQRALGSLVSRGKIIEKVYGKQKIYCIAQQSSNPVGGRELDEIIRQLDSSCSQVREDLTEKQKQIRAAEGELLELSSKLSVEDALREIESLEESIQCYQSQLEEHETDGDGQEAFSSAGELSKDALAEKYNRYLMAYRKRKRICTEMIDSIMESYPKSKQHLLDDIGVETDEVVDFKLE